MAKEGFTFIELVVIIIIVGILALTAVPRMMNIGEVRLDAAVNKVVIDLKYAREFAVNHNCASKVIFVPAADTYMVYENSSGSWVGAVDPATREAFIIVLNTGEYKGAAIESADFDGRESVEFDSIGAPYAATGSPLVDDGAVALSYNSGQITRNIKVAPVTGRVYVSQ